MRFGDGSDQPFGLRPQLALSEDDQVGVGHFAHDQRHRVDELTLVGDGAPTWTERHAVRERFSVRVDSGRR